MIQRKQTLFLLAVTIIAILMLFVPFQTINSANLSSGITILPSNSFIIKTSNIYYPFILNLLVIIVSLITIFLFKNRVLQYKLSNLIALFNVFIVGLFFLLNFTLIEAGTNINFTFGAFLPIINVFMAFLAAHFIKKDEQLVRNSDRIR